MYFFPQTPVPVQMKFCGQIQSLRRPRPATRTASPRTSIHLLVTIMLLL